MSAEMLAVWLDPAASLARARQHRLEEMDPADTMEGVQSVGLEAAYQQGKADAFREVLRKIKEAS